MLGRQTTSEDGLTILSTFIVWKTRDIRGEEEEKLLSSLSAIDPKCDQAVHSVLALSGLLKTSFDLLSSSRPIFALCPTSSQR